MKIERRTNIYCYSPTSAGCQQVLILRAYNDLMTPEIVMLPASFMGLSPWKSVLMLDKPVVLRERMALSRKGVKHSGSRPVLVCYVLMATHIGKP